ncbi:ATP-binding protein [Streptomyces sp. YS415]|uniref:ATP-binding protein n=1 Tax=Streptomyces sp. YS415 TaxID=2944806 RepID=UPI0020223AE5|nr:ATP-binding protein [Streptomyces sp. YS415]MCL7429834.1 ATP-binding protein [Streptomyces sp. YS415]
MIVPSQEEHQPPEGVRPQTAQRARDMTRAFFSAIAAHGRDEMDAALLVVSELVTNAIQHAGGVTAFRLSASQDTVTVSVQDASRAAPQSRASNPGTPGGFGWPLIQALAADVRIRIGPGGKAVSAVLPLPH